MAMKILSDKSISYQKVVHGWLLAFFLLNEKLEESICSGTWTVEPMPDQTRRRSAPRIKVSSVSAGIKLKKPLFTRGKEEKVGVLDIGPKGMSFEHDEASAPGTRFSFVVDFPQKSKKIRGTGTVRNFREREGRFILGMEFTKLSREAKDFLGSTRNLFECSETSFMNPGWSLDEKLKWFRKNMGLTLVEIASVSGLPATLVSRIEEGIETEPSEEELSQLARGMGIPLADLA
jgi:hypothetical protein